MTSTPENATCPRCGVSRLPDAAFCEECSYDFRGEANEPAQHTIRSAATPETAPPGEESPLDTGWTGRPARPSGDDRPQDQLRGEPRP